jgi:hypothetical protein
VSPNRTGGLPAHALLQDQSLVVQSQPECWPLVRPWLPLNSDKATPTTLPRATLNVKVWRSPTRPDPTRKATLRLGSVDAYVDDEAGIVAMTGAANSWGRIDLEALEGTLWADPEDHEEASANIYTMLTIGSAFLLGRSRRALIHAGAIVPPGNPGWLVVGDAQSGKSTTCASLAMTGCELLSDDQVVLSHRAGRVSVEGWLRPLHLDEGWSRGVPCGQRRAVHPSELGCTPPRRAAELGAAVFTSVKSDQPTSVSAMSAADAFLHIVRQSPWLLADRRAAPSVMETLSSVAALPCYSLQLGLDTFGSPDRLREVLHHLMS